MGRYSTNVVSNLPQPSQGNVTNYLSSWPSIFTKPVIGLDLNGTIIEDRLLNTPSQVQELPNALPGILALRLKGYKVMIISDQPSIYKKLITAQNIDESFSFLMQKFGQAGIQSIDGFLYNTSDLKEDIFAKPNTGMFDRALKELNINFKGGWYVGDSLDDLKMANNIGAKPILVTTGEGKKTSELLNRFTYSELKSKTDVFSSILEFAESLP